MWVRINNRWRQGRNRTAGNEYSYPKQYSGSIRNSSLKKALENLFHARPNKPREHNEVLAKVKYLKEKNSMKQPKKLTRNQKEYVKKLGKNPEDYMLHSEDDCEMILYNKREKRLESVQK